MNETTILIYEDVKGFLVETGDVMASGAAQGFDIMVKKNFWVDGVVTFSIGFILLLIWIYVIIKSIKTIKKLEKIDEAFFMIFIIMAFVVLFIGTMLYTGAAHMFVPEYYAIMDIIGIVK